MKCVSCVYWWIIYEVNYTDLLKTVEIFIKVIDEYILKSQMILLICCETQQTLSLNTSLPTKAMTFVSSDSFSARFHISK